MNDIIEILERVYKERGFDFRQYKETSLERRLQKRLRALNLNRCFVMDGRLRAKDFLKRNCLFMFHDLVSDKPLKAVDLILCRNVAIYFERALQDKIYLDFAGALNERGYLFLGKAETLIGPAREKFEVVDKRWKIFRNRERVRNYFTRRQGCKHDLTT